MGKPQRLRSSSHARLEVVGLAGTASPAEAAAVAAALERFMNETRASAPPVLPADPWRRAALLEGVGREPRDAMREPWI